MSLQSKLALATRWAQSLLGNPRESLQSIACTSERVRASNVNVRAEETSFNASTFPDRPNPLRDHFDRVTTGPGIWKWLHYFEIYHRHLEKFVNRDVVVAEIGIYSGGSLSMWKSYFGRGCHVHGVDIESACKMYESDSTTIHIGDQASRRFWALFKRAVPKVDVLIDDGGHLAEQQMVTLEEMLPHLAPGGVYICEDVCHTLNRFATFAQSLVDRLNTFSPDSTQAFSTATPFQGAIHSLHFYPFVTVIEKRITSIRQFDSVRRGTQWQPFYDGEPAVSGSTR